jgi:hypothetical protein
MFIFGMFQSNAQDNITKHPLIPQELTVGNKWPTQFIHDGLLGCYEGTKRWMVLSNPALIGTIPSPAAQRKIMIHCFCIVDKIRMIFPFTKYITHITGTLRQKWLSELYTKNALECITKHNTLEGMILPINSPKEPTDSSNILPEQQKKESNEENPNTEFQG